MISLGYDLKSTWLKTVVIVFLRHELTLDVVAVVYLRISHNCFGLWFALADTKRHKATLASRGFPLSTSNDSILLK
jgi:hypothetical protein